VKFFILTHQISSILKQKVLQEHLNFNEAISSKKMMNFQKWTQNFQFLFKIQHFITKKTRLGEKLFETKNHKTIKSNLQSI
jgi:hypothetical protein